MDKVDLDFSKIPWYLEPFIALAMLYSNDGLSKESVKEMESKYKEKYREEL